MFGKGKMFAAILTGGVTLSLAILLYSDHSLPVSNKENVAFKENMALSRVPEAAGNSSAMVLVLQEDAQQKATRLIQRAEIYNNKGYYREALQKAEEALQLEADNRNALNALIEAKNGLSKSDQTILIEANEYFQMSEFLAAVNLYLKYGDRHPGERAAIQPLLLKCYYNLGVLAIKAGKCNIAADYFRQILFIDSDDTVAKEALDLAKRCETEKAKDINLRMQLAFIQMMK